MSSSSPDRAKVSTMYDVIYIDRQGQSTELATALVDRQEACLLAREAAAERGTGRMVADSMTRLGEGRCRDTVVVVGRTLPTAA